MNKLQIFRSIKRTILIKIAKYYKNKKDYLTASVFYKKILSTKEKNKYIEEAFEYVNLLYKMNEYEKALKEIHYIFNTYDGIDTKFINLCANIYYNYAKNLYKNKDLAGTLEIIEEAKDKYNIFNYKLLVLRASALMRLKRFLEADESLGKAIEINPNKPFSHYLQGISFISQKRWYEAEISLLNAKELKYSTPKFYNRLGETYFQMGKFDKAIEAYKSAAKLWNDKIKAHVTIADIYYMIGLSYERLNENSKFKVFYDKAINNDIKNNSKELGIGVFHQKYKQYDLAIQSYSVMDSAEPLFRLAMLYEMMGNKDKAEVTYKKVISLNKVYAKYFFRLGALYDAKKEYKKASSYYKQAIARQTSFNSQWYLKLLNALWKSNDLREYDKVLAESNILSDYINSVYRNGNNKMSRKLRYNIFYERMPVNKKLVLFESMTGGRVSGNPLAIFEYMLNDDRFQNHIFIWCVNDYELIPEKYQTLENVIFAVRYTDLYYKYLASASLLVNDSAFPFFFIRKDDQKYLNTWHGTPWKTLGYDFAIGKMDYANAARNFLQSTHLLVPNQYTFNHQIKTHQISTIYPGELAITGYPRIDITYKTMKNPNPLKSKLQINDGRKIILYAPTWRGNKLEGRSININRIQKDLEKLSSLNAHIIFRGHYLIDNLLKEIDMPNITVLPGNIDMNEILGIVDILITDYSSVFFDFLVTEKPIIHYVYDYEEYTTERGVYFGLEELPGTVTRSSEEMIAAAETFLIELHTPTPKYVQAKNKYVYRDDGQVTERVVNWFVFDEPIKDVLDNTQFRKKILFHAGSFRPNGITSALINLIKKIDKNKYDITITFSDTIINYPKRIELLDQIKDDVNIIPKTGAKYQTDEGQFIENLIKNPLFKYHNDSVRKKEYNNEFRRIFSTIKFDYIIDYSGYSPYYNQLLISGSNQKAKKSVYLHNDLYSEYLNKHRQMKILFEQYKQYDKLISVSKPTSDLNQKKLAPRFSIDSNKFDFVDNVQNPERVVEKSTHVLDNPTDKGLFSDEWTTFITMGRLSGEKDHEKLIKAFAEIYKHSKRTQLLILGEGPLKARLLTIIKELNLQKSVKLLGLIANPYPYLKHSDCFVLSSNYEGQPVVLYEALILNKPIIATDIIANRGVLEGGYGELCENSIDGLINSMTRFLEGNILTKPFNIESYNHKAMEGFYNKVL